MVIKLTGILEDGNNPSRNLPKSARRTITVPRGTDLTVKLNIVYRGGPPVQVNPSDAAVFSIRRSLREAPIVARAINPSPQDGVGCFNFSIIPSDYALLDPTFLGRRLLFDVFLARESPDTRETVIPISTMIIEPSANDGSFSFMPIPTPIADGVTGSYTTDASVQVLDVVYLSGPDTVAQSDADDPGKQPVIGFVQAKSSTTQATVQYNGEISGFIGLIPNATYFLSQVPGQITNNVDAYPLGAVVQKVGFAKDSTTLVIMVDRDYTVL